MCKVETAAGGKKDLSMEGLPKGKEGALKTCRIRTDLALVRAPADILRRPSDRGGVGGKKLGRKWSKDGVKGSLVKQPQTSKYPPNLKINVLHVPALKDEGEGRCSRIQVRPEEKGV